MTTLRYRPKSKHLPPWAWTAWGSALFALALVIVIGLPRVVGRFNAPDTRLTGLDNPAVQFFLPTGIFAVCSLLLAGFILRWAENRGAALLYSLIFVSFAVSVLGAVVGFVDLFDSALMRFVGVILQVLIGSAAVYAGLLLYPLPRGRIGSWPPLILVGLFAVYDVVRIRFANTFAENPILGWVGVVFLALGVVMLWRRGRAAPAGERSAYWWGLLGMLIVGAGSLMVLLINMQDTGASSTYWIGTLVRFVSYAALPICVTFGLLDYPFPGVKRSEPDDDDE